MPSRPVPLISALFLGFLLVRVWLVDRRWGPLVAMLALCAAQGVVISFAQHHHAPGFAVVQPITAALIPPAAWLAFRGTAVRTLRASDWLHAAGPVLVALRLVARAEAHTPLIPALSLGYAAAGGSVSRYVSDARIRAAQDLPLAGKSITEAMPESGFNTKSNVNRESLRVAGQNPTDGLAERR